MHRFEYHRPTSLTEAESLLDDGDRSLLAGGMTLLPTMKMRLAEPGGLIDLGRIESLRGVREHGDGVEIGAMASHAAVARSDLVGDRVPALAALAARIGDPQVRNRGTLGGSLANSDPAADYLAAILALNATIVTNRRTIAADEFFVDLFETALAPREIITAVRFPAVRQAAYEKFRSPASRYAIAGVMVAVVAGDVRVAVTGAGPCAFRAESMEKALGRRFDATVLDGLEIDAASFNEDVHASQAYRAHLVGVLAARAVRAAQ